MYIIYDRNSHELSYFLNYCSAEQTLLQQGFGEVFPEQLTAQEYRMYDDLQQTVMFNRDSDPVEFVSLFRKQDSWKAIYKVTD